MTKTLTKTEAAILSGRTLFPNKVKAVSDGLGKTENVIKRSTNIKLGKKVTAKVWRDMPIYTVTLEERATCDKTCAHWGTCYGNNMPFATRYAAGADLESRMEVELETLQRKHPAGFVVRLHVLGDFYSVSYVAKWAKWLGMFPALRVYGYTNWQPQTDIGGALLSLIEGCQERFKVRFSSNFERDAMTALSMDDPRAQDMVTEKRAFICPVQTDKASDCGACGLCWTASKPVAFITH